MLFSHVFDCQVMTAPESNPGKENWDTFVTDKSEVSYILYYNTINIIILPRLCPSAEFCAQFHHVKFKC